jgi:hypothetical protein
MFISLGVKGCCTGLVGECNALLQLGNLKTGQQGNLETGQLGNWAASQLCYTTGEGGQHCIYSESFPRYWGPENISQ